MVEILPVEIIPAAAHIEEVNDCILRQVPVDVRHSLVASDLPGQKPVSRFFAEYIRHGTHLCNQIP